MIGDLLIRQQAAAIAAEGQVPHRVNDEPALRVWTGMMFFDLARGGVPNLNTQLAARGGATAIRGELDTGDDLFFEKRQPLALLIVPHLEDVERGRGHRDVGKGIGRRTSLSDSLFGLETDAADVALAEKHSTFRTNRTQL